MNVDWSLNIIQQGATVRESLKRLNTISEILPVRPLTLFVEDENRRIVGTLSGGDIRRYLVENGSILDAPVKLFMNREFTFIRDGIESYPEIKTCFRKGIELLPVLNERGELVRIYDLNYTRAILPVHGVIMAGGEGMRLRPLTTDTPKPMLKIGEKPIIERNVDQMTRFGISDLTISVRYLGQQIVDHFGNGKFRGIQINYVKEEEPLGTLGSVSLIDNIARDHVLLMNSDILSTINLETFYDDFVSRNADMSVVTVPYKIKLPYAVLETNDEIITGLREKPEFVHYMNAGIYLIRRELLRNLEPGARMDTTDFIEDMIRNGARVVSYPFWGYWLDIGNHEDFVNAQRTIKILDDE